MLTGTGLYHDAYPLRPAAPRPRLHSTYLSATWRRRLTRAFSKFAGPDAAPAGTPSATELARLRKLYPDVVASEFARFSRAMDEHLATALVGRRHVDAAYGLLHRRVELMPLRIDRVAAAGMAATVLARLGERVHLVVDGPWGIDYLGRWLLPVLERLGIAAGVIGTGCDEGARRQAYRQPVTIVTARECAMDFLRDAHNWPERGDPAMRLVDRLMGSGARQQATLMQGLPFAILLDIDSALVDNARTPIVLTREAHPMHEKEALEKAVAMVDHLQQDTHFRLTGEGAEVTLTPAGEAQLDQWAERLGGIWSVPHAARQLLCVALLAAHVLERDVHYRVANRNIDWLVPEALVPGLAHYTDGFLLRMLETMEGIESAGQREVVGRASYQQVFNRYVHLCGLAHSLRGIASELRVIYGLRSGGWRRRSRPCAFDAALLAAKRAAADAWLQEWLANSDGAVCRVVSVNSTQRLEAMRELMSSLGIEATVVDQPPDDDDTTLFVPGRVLVVLAPVMDYLAPKATASGGCSLEVVVCQRSARLAEDRRNLHWIATLGAPRRRRILLMSRDDELFEGVTTWGILRLQRFMGRRLTASALDRRIRRLQARRAREFYRVRRDLLNYDTSMQGLLSISGRGLYE